MTRQSLQQELSDMRWLLTVGTPHNRERAERDYLAMIDETGENTKDRWYNRVWYDQYFLNQLGISPTYNLPSYDKIRGPYIIEP